MMDRIEPPLYMNVMNDSGKTALVTGGNKGIGFEVARVLAHRGYTVWLGCRDEARGRAAAQALRTEGDVRFLALDVTDDACVREAARAVSAETDRLDVLVNNAGIYLAAGDGVPSVASIDCVRATYDVNVFGALRVTQAFVSLLRAAPAARVVNVGATLGSLTAQCDPDSGLSRWPTFAYSSSKTALNALTVALANEWRDTPLKVNTAMPGFVATDLNGNTGTLTTAEGARIVVRLATLGADGPSGGFFAAEGHVAW